MGLTIQRKKDVRQVSAFTHKLADIPNGVTVNSAELASSILQEGTPIGKDANGLYHVVKVAILTAANTTGAVYTVKKGHDFKVGNYVMSATGAKAYAIASIATNATDATSDDITLGTTIGTAAKGACLYEAAAESATTTSAFKYDAMALVGESYDVEQLTNHLVNAITIGQIRESNIKAVGALVKAKVPGILFI